MKSKLFRILAIGALSSILPLSTAFAYVITVDPLNPEGNTFGSIIIDFEGNSSPSTGDGQTYATGTFINGVTATPFDLGDPITDPDNDFYFSITGTPGDPGEALFTFGSDYDYFGLYWGSIDDYNSIQFYNNGSPTADPIFAGDFLGIADPDADGNQTFPGTNRYVNFSELLPFDAVVLASSGAAFELDNIAIISGANVPIPAAVWLLGSGLFGIALIRRRK